MKKMTPAQIQEINRRIAAGTYVHEEEEEIKIDPPKKPRGRPPKKVNEDE